jgi:DNA-binding transcriptional LysR family regulator
VNTAFFKYVIEVERMRSITKAAENLYMAQPNLSKAIKEMESELGFAIFKRTSKGVAPTADGRRFLRHAHNIVEELDRMEAIAAEKDESLQTFRISIPRGSYIARGFASFAAGLDSGKGIDITIEETNSLRTINGVADRRFSLGIVRYQTKYEQYFLDFLAEKRLRYEPVWEFQYVALLSAAHPLAQAEKLDLRELRKCTEIVHGDTAIPYLSGDAADAGGSVPRARNRIVLYERGNQFELLMRIPTTFMWVSPIPEETLSLFNLVQRSCDFPGNQQKDVLVFPERYKFTGLDKKFIEKLHESRDEAARLVCN